MKNDPESDIRDFDVEFEYTGSQLRESVRNLFCALIGYLQEREYYLFRNYSITQNNVCSVFIYDLITQLEQKGIQISKSSRRDVTTKLESLLSENKLVTRIFWTREKPMIYKPIDTELLYGYKTVERDGFHYTQPDENFWEKLLKTTEMVYGNKTSDILKIYPEFLLTSVDLIRKRNFFGDFFENEVGHILEKCMDVEEKIRRIEDSLSYLEGYGIFVDIMFGIVGEWLCWKKTTERKSWKKLLLMSDMGYTPDIRSGNRYPGIIIDAEKISCTERAENNVYCYYVEVDETWLATFSLPVENRLNQIFISSSIMGKDVVLEFTFKKSDGGDLAPHYYGVRTHPVVLKGCTFPDRIREQEEHES